MTERRYFDQSGEPSDEPGRFVRVDGIEPLRVLDGLEFRPVSTDSVMTNFVTFAPDAPAPMHHHAEQQIAIVLTGELELSVGAETRTLHAGDCVVIPPHVPHGGAAGPEGCTVVDVFTPPRAAIVDLMG
jgi:quercetin dioxygenase-like cupin family protein